MRPLTILAAFLLIGLLGVGAWFAGRGPSAEPLADLERASAGPRTDARPAPAQLQTPAALEGTPDARAAVAADTQAAPRAAAAKPERREAPKGAVLVGRILDDTGRPIRGARVRAGEAHGLLASRSERRGAPETLTDEQGRFELEVSPGDQELRAEADFFAPDRRHVSVQPASRKDLGDWELDPGVVLEGIVLDPGRRPVPGAEIYRPFAVDQPGFVVLTSERGPLVATTGADGRFRIASQSAGDYRFVASSEAYPDASFQGAAERPGERVDGIEVVFAPGAEIAGRVIDAPPGEELVVRAHPIAERDGFAMLDFSADVPTQEMRQAPVAADGTFLLRGLQVEEDYRLTARVPSGDLFFEGSRTAPVVVASGSRGVKLEYAPGGTLTFQVIDSASGEPVLAFEAEAGARFLQPLVDESGRTLQRHEQGRARFVGLRSDSAGERIALAVHAVGYEDYRQDGIELDAGEVKDLGVLRLRRIPVVRVIARDADGQPVSGARVTLAPVVEDSGSVRRSFSMRREVSDDGEDAVVSLDDGSRSGTTDANGVCELSSFPGATCKLRVTSALFAPYASEALRLPALEDFEHAVRMTAGGIVEVSVVDVDGVPVAGARVEHRSQQAGGHLPMGDFEAPLLTQDSGLARFERLEPGAHLFRLDESGSTGGFAFIATDDGPASSAGWEVIQVAGGEVYPLTLVASPRASLLGRVTEGGEPLAGATVRLSGEEEEGPMQGMHAFGGGGATVKTDADGGFEFADKPAGTYTLGVSHRERAMPAEFEVELFAGSNRQNIDLARTSVAGRVKDLEGQPIVGAVVQAKRYEGQGRRQMVMMMTVSSDGGGTMISSGGEPASTTLTDEDGRYELRGVEAGAEIVVEASSDDHRTQQSDPLRVAAGQARTDLDLTLTAAGRLTVKALRDGEPTGNQLVRASFVGQSDEPVAPEIAVLRNDGQAELTGLRAGPWTVKVSGFDNPSGDGAPEQTIEVVAGETKEALFELP